MASGVWEYEAEPVAPPATARVRLRLDRAAEDWATLLWRQLPLMILVFIVVLALGVLLALRMKTTYAASSSLLVRLGQEYVYEPRVGDAGRGAVPQNDEVIQSEVEILGSAELKSRVIHDIGLERFDPKLGAKFAAAKTPEARRDLEGAAIRDVETKLKITTAPDTSIVRLAYSHPDPRVAALVLNTLVDEYLVYRRSVLLAKDTAPLDAQRRAFEGRLADADAEYTKFLTQNGIGDFDAEKASLAALYGQLLGDTYSVRAQASEAEGRLGATTSQLSVSTPEIGIYRDIDHTAADKLATLRVELQDLLGRYQPTSQPVHDKMMQVQAMERLAAAAEGNGVSARRLGPNPVFQALQTERNAVAAQSASLKNRSASLAAELARVTARRQQLAELEPRYQALTRNRDLLAANVKAFSSRTQDAQAAQALAAGGDDGSVRVVQRAYVPTKGVSLKRPLLAVSVLFAGFCALCAGLIGAFLSSGFPSARAVERELELPVLAVAPAKARA